MSTAEATVVDRRLIRAQTPALDALQALPNGWRCERLKYHVHLNPETLGEGTPPDQRISYIDISSVSRGGRVAPPQEFDFGDAPSRARRVVRAHDTIVSTVRTYLRAVAWVPVAMDGFICSTGFAVLRPRGSLDPAFLHYWASSTAFIEEMVARSVGVGYPAINASEVIDIPVPLPPLEEQRTIVERLDRKIAQIDALYTAKRRLLRFLAEKTSALITRTTAVGLNADRPVEETGLDWPEFVPVGWQLRRLRELAAPGYKTFTDGDWIETPYITDEGIRLVQTGNVGIGRYREQGFRYVSEETFSALRCTEVLPDDVLICRLADPVGRACLAPDLGTKMITSVDVCILRPSAAVDRRFVVYALTSDLYLQHLANMARGGTRDRVSRSQLGAVKIALPPLDEQKQIADFLDDATARMNQLSCTLRRQLQLLEEHRDTLIFSAVTGRLEE